MTTNKHKQRTSTSQHLLVGRLSEGDGDSRSDVKYLEHALMHVKANTIDQDKAVSNNEWYCGNKEQFIKRHKECISFLTVLIYKLTNPAHNKANRQ